MALFSSTKLVDIYEDRIGRASTEDEAMGYWVFVAGVLVGTIGLSLILLSTDAGQNIRGIGNVLASISLILLLMGPIIRLPLTKKALPFLYIGSFICVIAIGWFALIYPEG
jgi:hypothetical protein